MLRVYLAMLCAALNGKVIREWNAVCRSFVNVRTSFARNAGFLSLMTKYFEWVKIRVTCDG